MAENKAENKTTKDQTKNAGATTTPAQATSPKVVKESKYEVVNTLHKGEPKASKDGKSISVDIVGYVLRNKQTGATMGMTVEQAALVDLQKGGIANAQANSRKVQKKDEAGNVVGEDHSLFILGINGISLKDEQFLFQVNKDKGKAFELPNNVKSTAELDALLKEVGKRKSGGGGTKVNSEERRKELLDILGKKKVGTIADF